MWCLKEKKKGGRGRGWERGIRVGGAGGGGEGGGWGGEASANTNNYGFLTVCKALF